VKKLILIITLIICQSFGVHHYCRFDGSSATGLDTSAALALGTSNINSHTFAADDTCDFLSRGGNFTSQISLPKTGTAGHPVVFQNYPGQTPVITGSKIYIGWDTYGAGTGSTWKVAAADSVMYAFNNNVAAAKGVSATALYDGEWFWESNFLYFRWDAGNPDTQNRLIEGSSGSTTPLFMSGAKYVNISGIIIRHGTSYNSRIRYCKGLNISNCTFQGGGYNEFQSDTNLVIKDCQFLDGLGNSDIMQFTGYPINDTMIYCLVKNSVAVGILTTGIGNIVIKNCTVSDIYARGIYANATGAAVAVSNTILNNCNYGGSGGPLTKSVGATLTYDHNRLTVGASNLNGLGGAVVQEGGCTDGGENIVGDVKFKKTRYQGYYFWGKDDYIQGLDPFISLADTSAKYGFKTHLWLSSTKKVIANDWTTLRNYSASGHTIGVHSTDHVDWNDLKNLRITYTGAAAKCTVYVDHSEMSIRASPLSVPTDSFYLDISNASYNSISKITTYIEALPNFGCTNLQILNADIDSKMLATQKHDCIVSPCTTIVDTSIFYTYEIDTCKKDIETNANLACSTMAWSVACSTQVGFLHAKQTGFTTVRNDMSGDSKYMSNVNVLSTYGSIWCLDTAASKIDTQTVAFLDAITGNGWNYCMFYHMLTDNEKRYWGRMIHNCVGYSGRVVLANQIAGGKFIRANGSTIDSITWHVHQSDSSDYRLQPSSICATSADTTALSGIPNLRDLEGNRITDAMGKVLYPLSMGAYNEMSVVVDSIRGHTTDSIYQLDTGNIYGRGYGDSKDSVKIILGSDTTTPLICTNILMSFIVPITANIGWINIIVSDGSFSDTIVFWCKGSRGYTVTYSGNTSTGGTVPVDAGTYIAGATVTVLGNTGNLAKTGFTFGGWNTAADGSGTSYAPAATFTMGSANVTLYAKWSTSSAHRRRTNGRVLSTLVLGVR
jgi:uncharacterized repeat protein (TIGR02543 family)